MLVPRCRDMICLALLAVLPGCSSLLSPRPHRLMKTTREMAEAAPLPAALPRELAKQVLPEFRVAPGDVLLVEPVDFNSSVRLPADQKVQPDGKIDLGQYGRIVVTGLSMDEIRIAVEGKIAAKEGEPEAVHVRLTEPESQVYYIVGEVNSPASYPLIGRETVLDAILAAGGLTDHADRHNIVFTRPTSPHSCRSVLPICYRHIVELGDTSTNYQVMPGDRIYVPSVPFSAQVHRTLFPNYGERCPRCAGAQVPCPPGAVAGAQGPPIAIPPAEPKRIIHHPVQAKSTRHERSTGLRSYLQ
jgi:polysaccharide export outer membrane protein